MRNQIMTFAFFLCTFLLWAEPTFAQDQKLDIAPPPEGSLSAEQLQAIAKDIRRLEANPLAPDAKLAGATLLAWAINSPDVDLSFCTNVFSEKEGSKSKYYPQLLLIFLFSSAAHIIEHPEEADDAVKVNVGGLQGVIRAYNAMKTKEGEAANDDVVETFIKMAAEKGKLEEHVAEALKHC